MSSLRHVCGMSCQKQREDLGAMFSATGQMVPFFLFASQKHLFHSCGQGKFHVLVDVGRAFLERLSNKRE